MRLRSSANASLNFLRHMKNCSIALSLVLTCMYTCSFASAGPQAAPGLATIRKQTISGPKAAARRVTRTASDPAATFQVLHQFAGTDGVQPIGGLALGSNGEIYGTTIGGRSSYPGTLFRLQGTAFTTLAHVPNPYGSVVADSDGNLYGTTINGGGGGGIGGTVFRWDPDTGLSVIHAFTTNGGGAQPYGGLARGADGTLYGTTYYTTAGGTGAQDACGTIFSISPAGKLKTLFTFPHTAGVANNGPLGCNPGSTLVRVGDKLYGTAVYGNGEGGPVGNPFVINVDGTGFSAINVNTKCAGFAFQSGLARDAAGNVWGVTTYGGCSPGDQYGTIFEITASGRFSTAYSFQNGTDGAYPTGTPVIDQNGILYGTAGDAPCYNCEEGNPGTVFAYSTKTGTLTTLHTFVGTDGRNPWAGLVRDPAGNLYGVTQFGGANNDGVIFEVTP